MADLDPLWEPGEVQNKSGRVMELPIHTRDNHKRVDIHIHRFLENRNHMFPDNRSRRFQVASRLLLALDNHKFRELRNHS